METTTNTAKPSEKKMNPLLAMLNYHVTGAIERGEKTAIAGIDTVKTTQAGLRPSSPESSK